MSINSDTSAEPITVTLKKATEKTGLSRSTLYRLAGTKAIRMVKQGRTTLIPWASLKAYTDSLQEADIKTIH